MTETTQLIPFAAWEQAVFVALFIILVVGLLGWFTKQSDKWQKFMLEIDEKWRAFNKEQRADNNCRMEEVNKAVGSLATVIQSLAVQVQRMGEMSEKFYEDFRDHDDQAKEILSKVTKPTRAPRTNGTAIDNKE